MLRQTNHPRNAAQMRQKASVRAQMRREAVQKKHGVPTDLRLSQMMAANTQMTEVCKKRPAGGAGECSVAVLGTHGNLHNN